MIYFIKMDMVKISAVGSFFCRISVSIFVGISPTSGRSAKKEMTESSEGLINEGGLNQWGILLIPQCIYRVKERRLVGRIESEEYSHQPGKTEGQQN